MVFFFPDLGFKAENLVKRANRIWEITRDAQIPSTLLVNSHLRAQTDSADIPKITTVSHFSKSQQTGTKMQLLNVFTELEMRVF